MTTIDIKKPIEAIEAYTTASPSALGCFGFGAWSMVFIPLLTILRGFVLQKLWVVVCSELTPVASLKIPQALGLSLIIGLFASAHSSLEKATIPLIRKVDLHWSLIKSTTRTVGLLLSILGTGWIIQHWV